MLKKIILISTIFTLSLFGFEYDLKPKKVGENVWCFFGKLEMPTKQNGGDMSNSCWVKTDKSFIVFDSGATYKYAEQSYKEMSKIAKLPVSAVLNSHYHDDHWLGNNFYKEKFNAKLIGTKAQDDTFKPGDKTRMFRFLTADAIEGTKIVPLDEHITATTTKTIDGVEIEIVNVGKSHSAEDIYFYLPKQKMIIAGDLVMNGRITSNRDGRVIGQIKALESMNSRDWNTLIAGHGFDISKTAMDESLKYFDLLKKRILSAIEDDVGYDEINTHVKMEEYENKAMYKLLNSLNVSDAYSELEFYEEE